MKHLLHHHLYLLLLIGMLLGCQNTISTTPKASPAATVPTQIPLDVDVATFKSLISQPNTIVLDVRTPEETAEGKIAGALEIDYHSETFKNEISKLDKTKTYLVYCRSGGRSASTCELLSEQGFQNLHNLLGGYTAWQEQ